MNRTHTLRWIYGRVRRFLPAVVLISLLGALASLSGVALALLSRSLLDIATGARTGSFRGTALLLFAVIAGQILIQIAGSALQLVVEGRLQMSLRAHLFGKLTEKAHVGVSGYHSGDLLNRFTGDIDAVVGGVVSMLPGAISLVTRLVAGLTALFLLNAAVAGLTLAVGLLFPLVGRLVSRRYKHLHKEMRQADGVVRSFLQECFQNLVLLKSFPSREPIEARLSDKMRRHYRILLRRGALSIFSGAGLFALFTLGYYLVLAWGAQRILPGAMTYGTLMAFLQIVAQLRAPLQNVSGLIPQFFSMTASAERLIELETLPDEPARRAGEALDKLCRDFTALCAEGLTFAYETGKPVISDTSFTLQRGSVTAITGLSGAGKSTLFRLLLGLYEPTAGSLCVLCGEEKLPTDAAVRGLFAYVPQGNLILSGTIRDNLSFCNPDASPERIEQAVEAAVMTEFVAELPDGLDTVLGERGLGLSEGQLQRISIARALVTDAPVLLLDECTSALDATTERRLLANLRKLPGRTVLFISHRPFTAAECDQVLHLEDGRFTLLPNDAP